MKTFFATYWYAVPWTNNSITVGFHSNAPAGHSDYFPRPSDVVAYLGTKLPYLASDYLEIVLKIIFL
ncbi:MAG: hypothetical protein H6731_00520 [Myxococcales bacterium]|nr:MAG: hypothetical protein H6731_00520 [Myxococcales bacterium]